MCSWRDAPNPQPTYQPPAASTFLIFFMPLVKKSADAEWKCHILNSPESPKSSQLWNLKYMGLHVCVIFRLCLQCLWHPLSQTSNNHVQGVISPTLVTGNLDPAMHGPSGCNTDTREAFTTCRGSAPFPTGTREPHPCCLLLVCLCVFWAPHALQM